MTDKAASTSATERVAQYAAIVSSTCMLLLSGAPTSRWFDTAHDVSAAGGDRNGLDAARHLPSFFFTDAIVLVWMNPHLSLVCLRPHS